MPHPLIIPPAHRRLGETSFPPARRGDRVADRAGLEIQCGVTPTEGSNPSLSAPTRCPKLLPSDFGQRRFHRCSFHRCRASGKNEDTTPKCERGRSCSTPSFKLRVGAGKRTLAAGRISGILSIGKLDHLRRVCSLFRSCGASLRHDQILSHSRQNRHILNNRCDDEISARVTSLVGGLIAF